jgi:hypothetical protein
VIRGNEDSSLEIVLRAWLAEKHEDVSRGVFTLAGASVCVDCDDEPLLVEIGTTLGGPVVRQDGGGAILRASVWSRGGPGNYGHLKMVTPTDDVHSPDDLLLGLSASEPLFTIVRASTWTTVAMRGEREPLFMLNGAHCLFRLTPTWRTTVSLFLFNRLLRLRRDAIFLHASSVAIRGQGALFIGPSGRGKSTIALALAARGHSLLGDDTACYLPATGELLPCQRAVGIRPGPRAKVIERALVGAGHSTTRGAVRVAADSLLPGQRPEAVRLTTVVFLDPFAPEPELVRIEPTREELRWLQPVVGSLVNAAATRRVFELTRLLSSVAAYRLRPGDPDDTARCLEEALAAA